MNILSIETSCDETAVSVVEALGDFPTAKYEVLGNALRSQIELHREYGGVFPMLAKRDHAGSIIPLLEIAISEANLPHAPHTGLFADKREKLEQLLEREPGLAEQLFNFYERYDTPNISMIAVTAGPGLEPALWVGVNFAKALAQIWDVPLVAVNHLEGHILASVYDGNKLHPLKFPALALIVSGGHTEFVLMEDWGSYKKIGQTRDDAVGEAFDKVARLIGLPYPGGPEISRRASEARAADLPTFANLPRPMLDSGDLDVSFSGLKTAVRYAVTDKELSTEDVSAVARDFEDAAVDVLVKKTKTAIDQHGIQSLIVGGGVSANQHLRNQLLALDKEYPELAIHLPDPKLSTDNSIMIALAGHAHQKSALGAEATDDIRAEGNKTHRRIPFGKQLFE